MGRYVSLQEIQLRTAGKVRYQDPTIPADQQDPNRMPIELANQLISEGEGQVEMDLSPRYATPLRSIAKGTFQGLDPKGTTFMIIKGLVRIQATIKILETDFGSGSAVDATKYIQLIEKRYKKILDEGVLAKYDETYKSSRQWKFPPLPDLMLAPWNSQADDGYAGMVTVTDRGEGLYPVLQIDDPSEDWFNATFDTDH